MLDCVVRSACETASSTIEDSNLKKKLKNKSTHKVKHKDKDIKNKIKTSQNKDSDSMKESENEDAHEVKRKDKDIKNRIKVSKDKNSDSAEDSENEDTHEVKRKNKDIKNGIKISQNKDSDSMKESENEDAHEVKCNTKDIKNVIKTSQDHQDRDSMEESENEDAHEVKRKDKDIKNRIKISKDKNSDSAEDSENEDAHEVEHKDENIRNGTKMIHENNDLKNELKNKDIYKIKCKDIGNWIKTSQNKNKDTKKQYIHEAGFGDADIKEEYCSDATFLARQIASSERLCQEESEQLYNLCVQLRHTVPPQHEIERRAGSHMPTQKEIEKFEEIVSIKRGSYSFTEDNIIASNWKAFCKLHKWNVKKTKPFLQMRTGRLMYMRNITERRKFVQFLADGLPNRTLYSVYHRFKTLYGNNLQRRYKPEEDEMIIDHLEHNPSLDESRKYADLAKVLRRTRHSIWRRYRILKKKNKRRKNA